VRWMLLPASVDDNVVTCHSAEHPCGASALRGLGPSMATITFDTHKFISKLCKAGVPEEQAEVIAEAFAEAHMEAEVATKADLRELEYRLTIKLGAMILAAIAAVATLVNLSFPE
jgi:hypothetical protein